VPKYAISNVRGTNNQCLQLFIVSMSCKLRQNWALGSRPTRTINRRLAGWAAKRIITHEALVASWVPGCLARRQTSALLWTSDDRRPSAQPPSPSCHHRSYCCTVAQLRRLLSSLRTMEIVQLLKCVMCIAWTFSTSPQKPPTTYTRVKDFRPHRDSLFREATYTRVYTVYAQNVHHWLKHTLRGRT